MPNLPSDGKDAVLGPNLLSYGKDAVMGLNLPSYGKDAVIPPLLREICQTSPLTENMPVMYVFSTCE
jgi:hypothetical protein